MKIRTDFVTNSSSASFILSMNGDFTDRQGMSHYTGNQTLRQDRKII